MRRLRLLGNEKFASAGGGRGHPLTLEMVKNMFQK